MTEPAPCLFAVGERARFTNYSRKAGPPGVLGLPVEGQIIVITEVAPGPFGWYLKWKGSETYPGGALHQSEFTKLES